MKWPDPVSPKWISATTQRLSKRPKFLFFSAFYPKKFPIQRIFPHLGRFGPLLDCYRSEPSKGYVMKTTLLIKEIYAEAFRDLGHYIVRNYFKLFAWFSFAMFLVVLYAFIFRLSTGFVFD